MLIYKKIESDQGYSTKNQINQKERKRRNKKQPFYNREKVGEEKD